MATVPYVNIGPIVMGLNEATHRTHTDGDDHDIWAAPYVAPCAGHLIAMRYQITTTMANDTVAAVIGLIIADHDGSTNLHDITESNSTLADATAAANAWVDVPILGGNGHAVTSGQTVNARVQTAGTDSGAVAGSVRILAIFMPGEL